MKQHKQHGTIVAIELTNHCNLKCVHCPQGRLDVPKGYMDKDTFKKCIKYCKGYTELNWRGESLLHPNLIEYIRIAKEFNKSLNLGFHTNALLMTEELFKELAHGGLNWIHVSLHTPESCIRYKQIQEWNTKLGNKIYVYAEVDTAQEELTARSFGLYGDQVQNNHLANWGGFLTDYRIVNSNSEEHARNCLFYLENKFVVAWNGIVNACCWDYEQCHRLGHIDDFENIRHKPPYKLCSSCIWISRV